MNSIQQGTADSSSYSLASPHASCPVASFGLLLTTQLNKRRLVDFVLLGLGIGIIGGAILLLRNVLRAVCQISQGGSVNSVRQPPRSNMPASLDDSRVLSSSRQVDAKRVIICTIDFHRKTYLVSYQGGEPFEVPFHNSSMKVMTPKDWEGVFPGLGIPANLSDQGKLVFGGGRYYSYFGSYFDVLNETSCPFEGWEEALLTQASGEETEPSGPPVAQTYDDLISFLDSRGVYYGGGDTEDGGKSVSISVEQEWTDGMIPDDDARKAINTVTYYYNENNDLAGVELYLWAPRLLDFVNEDVPESGLILSSEDLPQDSISAICAGSNNCSISGLPEGIVEAYWSQKINQLVEQYMNVENLY